MSQTLSTLLKSRSLEKEGIRPGSQTPVVLELDGWDALIRQLSAHRSLMILERELGPAPAFAIGRPVRITAAQVEFQTVSGIGKWAPKNDRLKFSQLTCLQVNNRYLSFYRGALTVSVRRPAGRARHGTSAGVCLTGRECETCHAGI